MLPIYNKNNAVFTGDIISKDISCDDECLTSLCVISSISNIQSLYSHEDLIDAYEIDVL